MYVCSSVTVCVLLLLIATKVAPDVYVGITSVVIKTEAGSNDITECRRNDKPSTSMFAVFLVLYCLRSFVSVILCIVNHVYDV